MVAVFGGAPIRDQASRAEGGAQVVVGTVGRVMDLIGRHHLFLDDARYVVLDEADEMLDLGFLEDVETILGALSVGPPDRAVLGHDAAARSRRLAEKFMYDPVTIKVKAATLTIDTVEQFYVEVPRPREAGRARAGAQGRAPGPGDHLRAHQDRRRPARAPARTTPACA